MPLESTETITYAVMIFIGAVLYGSSFALERGLLSRSAAGDERTDEQSRAFRKMRFAVSWLLGRLMIAAKLKSKNIDYFPPIADIHGRFKRFGVSTPDLDVRSRKFLLDWTLFLATVRPCVKSADIEGARAVMKRPETPRRS